jgi:glutathione S-transferase
MAGYRLFGAATSPYSEKVRAVLRYKAVEFDWVGRARSTDAEFKALAQLPTVPLLVSSQRPPLQDSAAILLALETDHPEPALTPDDPACTGLSMMLEGFGDEWLNKCMFQQRWGAMPDRLAAALRTLEQLMDGKRPRAWKAPAQQIAERMIARLPLVGAEPENWETLQSSYRRFALRLNTHLQSNLFIFGGRPTGADFAVAAQLQQMLTDPTPAEWLKDRAPFVVAWCAHMLDPKPAGGFAGLGALSPTLSPIFDSEIARTYLPWASANAASAQRDRKRFSVTLADGVFEQNTQRHAALAFRGLQRRMQRLRADPQLAQFMRETGLDASFASGQVTAA